MKYLFKHKLNLNEKEWTLYLRNHDHDSVLKDNDYSGYCDELRKVIIIGHIDKKDITDEFESKEYRKKALIEKYGDTIRHEIIHAMLFSCGLGFDSLKCNGSWAVNEEMVDWFAINIPKIHTKTNKIIHDERFLKAIL